MTDQNHVELHVARCLNCGEQTPRAFCSACGQEAVGAHVSFREQLSDFFGEMLSVEARLPRTLKVLFVRPGELTRAYNAGQRIRYVTPLKTLLFAAFVYFSLYSFMQSANVAALQKGLAQVLASPLRKHIPPAVIPHIESVLANPTAFVSVSQDISSKLMIALVPVHALLLKIAYRKSGKVYGEHIVFSLHVHAFRYLLYASEILFSALLRSAVRHGLSEPWSARLGQGFNQVLVFWICTYLVLAAKRVYGDGTWSAVRKMLWIGVVYSVVGMLSAGGVVLAAFLLS